jgi:hypothetical protein
MRTEKTCSSYYCELYLAGPFIVAEQIIREYCFTEGFCVTVTPTKYIYTGGEELGYVVKVINYARFPKDHEYLLSCAEELAELLVAKTFQKSYSILTPDFSKFVSVVDK